MKVRRRLHGTPLIDGVAYSPVRIDFGWDSDLPPQVSAVFHSRNVAVWTFCRDTLAAGLDAPAGMGDYTLIPDLYEARQVELVLDTPTGRVAVVLVAAELRGFLADTWAAVPAGGA